jgi:two-component system, NtrC family, nitrogen regulation response regulator NtrX
MKKDEKTLLSDVLIVDDEADIRSLIEGILNDEGFKTRQAASAEEALAAIAARRPALVILDIWLQNGRMDGIQVLDQAMRDHPDLPVIMISGHGNIETAVAAIKKGAYDFIEKPFKADRLLLMLQRALEAARLKRENSELRFRAATESELIGCSAVMAQIRQTIERVAPTSSRVFITGLPGVGKEVAARMIHARSKRAAAPFVVMNCATMRPEQLEPELFGMEPNANGGARKIGLFEQAHGGTLFLDEIVDMPLETQGKIVRALHEQVFTRVGGTTKVEVDVRVLASSNRDVQAEMAAGRLRQDLYYRLSVVPLAIPALAERRDDIPLLARHFLARATSTAGTTTRDLSDEALAALQAYAWPGNVRQLRNVMEWVLIMTANGADQSGVIRTGALPPEITSETPHVLRLEHGDEIMAMPLRDAREMFEREYLLAQVTRFGGNISRTAHFIGMERSALHRKLKLLGVHGNNDNKLLNEIVASENVN